MPRFAHARLTFDRLPSGRRFDQDGRLHVACSNISKACVNSYAGHEIPDAESLGLDPVRLYQILRPADELAKAVPTFNAIPLLSTHVPVHAEDHRPDLVVGATGGNAAFVSPYLHNSLVIWAADAIEGVVSGAQTELSAAYRYRYVPGAGVFNGERYDGKMFDIVANHVALVAEGRAGRDVVVGDAMPSHDATYLQMFPNAQRLKA